MIQVMCHSSRLTICNYLFTVINILRVKDCGNYPVLIVTLMPKQDTKYGFIVFIQIGGGGH